jgi:hypothetical protein
MVTIYEERGIKRQDAITVVKTMAKYKEYFIDQMMIDELGLQVITVLNSFTIAFAEATFLHEGS